MNSSLGSGGDASGNAAPSGFVSSVQGFDDLVALLKSSNSDAESLDMAQGMGELAQDVERITQLMQKHQTHNVGPSLLDLLGKLRKHRQKVSQLGASWQALPEFNTYMVSLSHFRTLLNQWLMERSLDASRSIEMADFEALAWRTLGDGMLLMDLHQQLLREASDGQKKETPTWWNKLRGE